MPRDTKTSNGNYIVAEKFFCFIKTFMDKKIKVTKWVYLENILQTKVLREKKKI